MTDITQDASDNAVQSENAFPTPVWGFYIGAAVLLLLYWILGRLDNFTELAPDHGGSILACFVVAGVAALLCVFAAEYLSRRSKLSVKLRLGVSLAIFAFASVFLASSRIADLVNGAMDFPAGKTKTINGLLLISRAYQTHGKSRSWNIQTMPIWSNLDITESDYQFMVAHRAPGDKRRDPDEIFSRGYFCAKVTLQESSSAVRVMNAGSQPLPEGTVIVCPAFTHR